MRRLAAGLALVVLAAGCSRGGEERGAEPGTAAPGDDGTTELVVPALGPPPTDCEGPAPRSKPPGYPARLLGRAPAWMGLYGDFRGSERAMRLPPDTPYTENGWRIKVLWFVDEKQEDTVFIASARSDGSPALIEVQPSTVALEHVALDPANPPAYSNPETADFPSYVYFPEAGCYAFEAAWPDGSWRVVLAVGR